MFSLNPFGLSKLTFITVTELGYMSHPNFTTVVFSL